MTDDDCAHGPHGNEGADAPVLWQRKRHGQHYRRHAKAKHEAPLEAAQHLADGHEEGHVLRLLGRRPPFQRDAEKVAHERLRDVQRDAAEENREQRNPLQVRQEAAQDGAFADAIAQHGERHVTQDRKDEHNGEVDWWLVSTSLHVRGGSQAKKNRGSGQHLPRNELM